MSREQAKRRLGIDDSTIVLFTAAAASKYQAFEPPSFLDLVVPVLQRRHNAVLVAAGPAYAGEWTLAGEQTGGRVLALGPRSRIDDLHAAADIYLDSYPFASVTSLTEAGCCGVPLMAFRGHPETAAVLGADSPGLDGNVLQPPNALAFATTLYALIDDEAMRREIGQRTRDEILDTHVGAAWGAACAEVFELASGLSSPPLIAEAPRAAGELDLLVDQLQRRTGWSLGLTGTLRTQCAILPPRHRLMTWVVSSRKRDRLPLRMLLPEWTTTMARAGWCRLRRRR